MTAELVRSLVDILDSAHQQRYQLAELLTSLSELKQHVKHSADKSKAELNIHFGELKSILNDALERRLLALTQEVDKIEESAVIPLGQCEEMIQQGINNASTVMEEGRLLMQNKPENNLEKIIKFKDNPLMKTLTSLPEIPCKSAVPNILVELSSGPLRLQLNSLLECEGRVFARAPVQITDIVERPGGLVVHWTEAEEDTDIGDFCLQYSYGNIRSNEDPLALWHTGYTGSDTRCIVRHLNTDKVYSFRVCGRTDPKSSWSSWSVPISAVTSIPHYQWHTENESYSLSNEDKTATRLSGTLTSVLYSGAPSVPSGEQVTFTILDSGEKSFDDGVGLSWSSTDTDSLLRPGSVFVDTNGTVFVDGQAMKTKLADIGRGSIVIFKTEPLPNGKVRISVEVNEQEVTFDWRVETGVAAGFAAIPSLGMPLNRQFSAHQLYFAMKFTHEDWKIGVE